MLLKNRNLWIINNVAKCRKRKRDTRNTKQETPYQFWQSEKPTGISVLFQTVRSLNRRDEKTKREWLIYKCYMSRPKNGQQLRLLKTSSEYALEPIGFTHPI